MDIPLDLFPGLNWGRRTAKPPRVFYSTVFGLSAFDPPMGPDVYTLLRMDGRDVGGCYGLSKEMLAGGVPPHWMVYVAVDDADATAKQAAELGGKAVMPPFDVADLGRMAVLDDPTGTHFAIWQAKKSKGLGIAGEPGTFCWADLNTPDIGKATAFYHGLFGWTFESARAGISTSRTVRR